MACQQSKWRRLPDHMSWHRRNMISCPKVLSLMLVELCFLVLVHAITFSEHDFAILSVQDASDLITLVRSMFSIIFHLFAFIFVCSDDLGLSNRAKAYLMSIIVIWGQPTNDIDDACIRRYQAKHEGRNNFFIFIVFLVDMHLRHIFLQFLVWSHTIFRVLLHPLAKIIFIS